MNKKGISFILYFIMLGVFCPSYDMFAAEITIPERHPGVLTEIPRCTACHSPDTSVALKPIAAFDHSSDWADKHRFPASESSRVCSMCHKVSFCTDCHAYKDELKPSDKYSGSTDRWLPHRGDYLFQHRIDGRLDPAKCFRCHGRQNNRSCKRCHK